MAEQQIGNMVFPGVREPSAVENRRYEERSRAL